MGAPEGATAQESAGGARAGGRTLLSAVATGRAIALVEALLENGKINNGNANSLVSKLDGIKNALDAGNTTAASGKLGALLNELDAMVRSGRVTEADIDALQSLVERVLESISP